MSTTTPPPGGVVTPVENKSLFAYTLWARDDERVLYAADDLQHIRYFASWLADDLYLDLKHADGSEVADGWQWGEQKVPNHFALLLTVTAAGDWAKAAALAYEHDLLLAQIARSKRAGF